jgi:hypothetical protein
MSGTTAFPGEVLFKTAGPAAVKKETSYRPNFRSVQEAQLIVQLKQQLGEQCHSPDIMAKELSVSEEGQHFQGSENFQIKLVQVVTRHGDRAPMFGTALIHMQDFHCPEGRKQYFSSTDFFTRRCYNAKLTWAGCRQFWLIGKYFRKTYQFGLTVDELERKLLLLSTASQRTVWSARCFAGGFFDKNDYSRVVVTQSGPFFYDNPVSKTDYVKGCPSYGRLMSQIRKQPQYQSDQSIWKSAIREGNDFLSLSRYKHNNITNIGRFNDALVCHFCHIYSKGDSNSATPCVQDKCMSPLLALMLIRATNIYTNHSYNQNISIAQVQPLIAQIVSEMEQWIKGEGRRVLVHYSGHDVTISALLSALGIGYGHRPPYASRLVFEMWKSKQRDEHIVRVLYNGQLVESRILGKTMLYENFRKRVLDGYLRDSKSHRNACQTGVW